MNHKELTDIYNISTLPHIIYDINKKNYFSNIKNYNLIKQYLKKYKVIKHQHYEICFYEYILKGEILKYYQLTEINSDSNLII